MIRALARAIVLQLRLFFTALQFFTRMPIPAWVGFEPVWLQRCVRYFPLIGALVGGVGVVALALAVQWWPPMVAVVLSMAATVWFTGGFHEDGWADTCDGLGGHVSKERALLIMKDSRLGTYGALGLILILMLKATVLAALLTPLVTELQAREQSHIQQVLLGWTSLGLIWAHALSRLMPVLLIRCLPYAGDADHAKAKPLALSIGTGDVVAALLVTLGVVAVLAAWLSHLGWPWATWWRAMGTSTLAALLITAWAARWFYKRLGGFTGDTLGATQQLSEVAMLLAWLAVVHPQRWGA